MKIPFALLLALIVESAIINGYAQAPQQLPNPPQVFLNTAYPSFTGNTINVPAGGDLQAAINSAHMGDEIVLPAGATFTGNFTLPAKTGSGWIVIRSSKLSEMPQGTRVQPTDVSKMASIVTPNNSPVFSNVMNGTTAQRAAQFYRFGGLEITTSDETDQVWDLIDIDDGGTVDPTGMPHDIGVDRCWVHGSSTSKTDRGFWMGGARLFVIDSYFSDFHDTTGDEYEAQALYSEDGPGPFKIDNNELEAAGENLFFGAPQPSYNGIVPSDIEIRFNHIMKPLSWQTSDWEIKNLFEIKNGQRILVDGNVFENNWVQSQGGCACVWDPRTLSGTAPWAVAQDITFIHNVVRNACGGISVAGYDNMTPSNISAPISHRVEIKNNLFYEMNNASGSYGFVIELGGFNYEITIDHNTMQTVDDPTLHLPSSLFVAANPVVDGIIENNIFDQQIQGQGTEGPATVINGTFTGSENSNNTFLNNLLVGPGWNSNLPSSVATDWNQTGIATSTFYTPSVSNLYYNNISAGNYSLGNASPYRNKGTDGIDLGYDWHGINIPQVVLGKPPFRH